MEAQERRLVFGEDAERYDRARPSYPGALIDDLVGWVGTDARAVDVGCGTGKATRLLAERGMTGVGVEAHPAMAATARRNLAPMSGWRVDGSDFEAWSPRASDVPVDLVTSAQAWHWVEPSVGLRKAHDLLRPGGWMAMWWNLADDDPGAMRQEIEGTYAALVPGEPFCPSLERSEGSPFDPPPERPGFDADQDHPRFGPAIHRLYHWRRTYTTAQLLDLLGTHSNHRVMEPDRRQRLLDAVADIVERHGGTYDYPYVCRLWAARRQP
ncbi:MAG: class I SAM-dependent methyltransferase [Acidimicrobiales bacterium]